MGFGSGVGVLFGWVSLYNTYLVLFWGMACIVSWD